MITLRLSALCNATRLDPAGRPSRIGRERFMGNGGAGEVETCLCGRAHPCPLHNLEVIRAKESGTEQPSLFDALPGRSIRDTAGL